MSRIKIGILGAIALSLSVGAAQLALGRDDLSQVQPQVQPGQSSLDGEISVNRGAKADRAMKAPVSHVETRTVVLQLTGFSDSILPCSRAHRQRRRQASSAFRDQAGNPRLMVACEPVVSMLVDEARQLQPGRCVT